MCKEFEEFYEQNGLSKILTGYLDAEESKKASMLWSSWVNTSGIGGYMEANIQSRR